MTATATKSANRKYGVNLDMIDGDALAAAAKKYEVAKSNDVGATVGALISHFRTKFKEDQLAKCNECGGVSPLELDACPFCGKGEAVQEETNPAAKPAPKPEPKPEAKLPPKPKPPVKDDKPTKQAKEDAMPDKKAADKKDDKPTKPKAVKAELVPVLPESLKGLSSRDLDKAVTEVSRLKASAATSMWELGSKIGNIHEAQLWKLRTNDDGKSAYRSFEAFCSNELKMSGTQAYNLMDIAKQFTPAQVKELGTTRLKLLMAAPEEDRSALEKEAKGKSTRQLQKKVKDLREKKGVEKRDTGRAPTPKSKGRKSEHITIVSVLGKKTLQCIVKPKKGEAPKPVTCPAAVLKWLDDQMPCAVDDLTNGVREVMILTHNSKGELVLKIERRREE